MRKLLTITLIGFSASFLSCLEEIDYFQDQYVKVLGLEGSALAERVIELDNGDIMIIGSLGRASHDVTSGFIGLEIGAVEDRAPFVAITDANGNIKQMKSYPIESFDLANIELENVANNSIFKEIIPDHNGGYIVLGQLSGFDLIAGPITIRNTPGSRTTAPFLVKLDENLNMKKLVPFELDTIDGNLIYRARAIMKPLPNNEVGLLLGMKVRNFTEFIGYAFYRMDHDLNILDAGDDFDRPGFKLAYDFVYDQENRVAILGERNDRMVMFRIPIDNMVYEAEEFQDIDHSGEFPNFNEHFILEQENGNYAILYTDPASRIVFSLKGPDLNNVGPPVDIPNPSSIESLIRVPRAFTQMINGDFLIYNQHIPDSQEPIEGYLHRVSSTGQALWSVQIDGTPGDVTETADGDILVVANTVYNETLHRINLIKLNENGELY